MKIVDGKKVICETKNFEVVAANHPFISREEGGHMMIRGRGDKYRYNSRLDFLPNEILEQQRLCQMICEAYKIAMKKRNIEIVRINFFEAGNWAWKKDENGNVSKAYYHEHIFGRTLDAKKQKFPDAPYLPDRKTGFYEGFEPLNDDDIENIIQEMKKLEESPKYDINFWKIDG
mgnify:FL=1